MPPVPRTALNTFTKEDQAQLENAVMVGVALVSTFGVVAACLREPLMNLLRWWACLVLVKYAVWREGNEFDEVLQYFLVMSTVGLVQGFGVGLACRWMVRDWAQPKAAHAPRVGDAGADRADKDD
jgi:hypothetical protein